MPSQSASCWPSGHAVHWSNGHHAAIASQYGTDDPASASGVGGGAGTLVAVGLAAGILGSALSLVSCVRSLGSESEQDASRAAATARTNERFRMPAYCHTSRQPASGYVRASWRAGCQDIKGIAMKTLTAMVVVLFAGLTVACGDRQPVTDCIADPTAPECSCDDGDPCTTDAQRNDACAHGAVEYGAPCIGQDGFCDSDGTCRQTCDELPCFDWSVIPSYGCVYVARPSGWTCTDGSVSGVCRDGVCAPPPTGANPS